MAVSAGIVETKFTAKTDEFVAGMRRARTAAKETEVAVRSGLGGALKDLKHEFGKGSTFGMLFKTLAGAGAIAGIGAAIHLTGEMVHELDDVVTGFRKSNDAATAFIKTVEAIPLIGKFTTGLATAGIHLFGGKTADESAAERANAWKEMSEGAGEFLDLQKKIRAEREKELATDELSKKLLEIKIKYSERIDQLEGARASAHNAEDVEIADSLIAQAREDFATKTKAAQAAEENAAKQEDALARIEQFQKDQDDLLEAQTRAWHEQNRAREEAKRLAEEQTEIEERLFAQIEEFEKEQREAVANRAIDIAREMARSAAHPQLAGLAQQGSSAAISAINRFNVSSDRDPIEYQKQAIDIARQQLAEEKAFRESFENAVKDGG